MMKKTVLILCILGDPVSPPASYHRTGGFNVDTAELISYFDAHQYSLAIITNTSKYCTKLYEKYNDYTEIYRIELSHDIMDNQEKLADKYNYFWECTLTIIKDNNICPVFIHSLYWYSGYLGSMLSAYLNIPFIHSLVALAADKDKTGALKSFAVQLEWEKYFLPKASLILAITESEKETIKTYYNIQDSKCIVVGRNVSSDFFAPHDEMGISSIFNIEHNDDDNLFFTPHTNPTSWWNSGAFLYMGRINHEKGVDVIIYAWYSLYQQYNGKVPPLWLVGGDPIAINTIREQLNIPITELEELEKENKICWWGYLNPPAISTLLMKSLVLIMHSQYESGGRIIIEAFSQSRPVIATPTGFGKDFIHEWVNGFLVPFGDIKCLMHKMEYFIKQPLLTKVLGQVAYQYHLQIQNMWDSKNKHLLIYKYFSTLNSFSNYELPKSLYANSFNPPVLPFGKISTYPYGYQEKENYENYIKIVYKDSMLNLSYKKNLSNKSYIWYMQNINSEFFVIKALFSIMNSAKIWNQQLCQEAITITESLERLLVCNHCKTCIPITVAPNGKYITMPYAERKNIQNLSIQDLREIAILCYRFNTSKLHEKDFKHLKPFWMGGEKNDIYNILKEVVNPFTATSGLFLNFVNKNNNEIQKLLSTAQKVYNYKSINYDNSIIMHLAIKENKLFLLPSRYIYSGPLGMDAGRLCIEYCLCSIYDKKILSQIVIILSEIYHIDPKDTIVYIKTNILLLLRKYFHLGFSAEPLLKLWTDIKNIN